jgi:hypothetical protein
MDRDMAAKYIRENFEPGDRLAIVILNKRTNAVMQRVASADKIASTDFQAWLRYQNAQTCEIYVSMNALRHDARGRTKADVAEIRHVYLDFDENGTQAVEALLKREDLPNPNYLLNSSPDKWQVIWKAEGFAKEQAEVLQRGLARETLADPAATDSARVLRLPGFYNHKYAKPHFVGVETLATETYRPEHFPTFEPDDRNARALAVAEGAGKPRTSVGVLSQSEHDWSFAKRALARGESEDAVIAAIANYRRYDKPNPQYYAELTVRKASESLEAQRIKAPVVDRD